MPHFQPKDRVSVPGVNDQTRVSATVVLTLPRGNASVLVHIDHLSERPLTSEERDALRSTFREICEANGVTP